MDSVNVQRPSFARFPCLTITWSPQFRSNHHFVHYFPSGFLFPFNFIVFMKIIKLQHLFSPFPYINSPTARRSVPSQAASGRGTPEGRLGSGESWRSSAMLHLHHDDRLAKRPSGQAAKVMSAPPVAKLGTPTNQG
jgi:hypothetical protein